jgi:prepilin-type N-terminal cleavage/methylation domain-containing protein
VVRRRSTGFTILELAVAMTVLGILASFAIPNYLNFMRDVRAAQAVAEVQALRAAVYMYFGDHQQWPPEEQAGIVPEALKPYLPPDFEFYKSSYRVDWDNWITIADVGGRSVSKSKFPETGVLVGISLVSNNKEFMKAARSLLGSANLVNLSPSRATLVVASQEGF